MILVSHSYAVRGTRIALVSHPSVHRFATFRTSYFTFLTSHCTRSARDLWFQKGAIRVTLTRYECDTRIMPWYPINIIHCNSMYGERKPILTTLLKLNFWKSIYSENVNLIRNMCANFVPSCFIRQYLVDIFQIRSQPRLLPEI